MTTRDTIAYRAHPRARSPSPVYAEPLPPPESTEPTQIVEIRPSARGGGLHILIKAALFLFMGAIVLRYVQETQR